MKPSIVAMFGRIMPAPLAMPVTVTVLPPIMICFDAALGNVSVVMMPCAASSQCVADRSASAAGKPATMRSTGSVSMITPVENGSTCSRCDLQVLRQRVAGLARAAHPVGTGAGIRIAGVDDDGADAALVVVQMLSADLHRRRAEAVQREHAGGGGAFVEHEDDEVAPVGLAHAGHRGADANAGHGMQIGGGGSNQVDGHGGPGVMARWPRIVGAAHAHA